MEEYFMSSLTKLNTERYNELTIVLGNESCDLDSAICSIVYATFLDWQYNQIKCKVCTKDYRLESSKDDIFVPILNVDRSEFELKTEVVFLLKKYGIYVSNLTFRDDHNLKELTSRTPTKVVLVDHHVMAKRDEFMVPLVTEIIDHRPLVRSPWPYKDTVRSTIDVVGSCCTLVTQRIKTLSTLMAHETDFFNAYMVCSKMLHAGIILDTVNFSKEVNKAKPLDEEMTLFLESLIKPADFTAERKATLDSLVAARSDVSNLTPAQILKKDLKIVGNILVPSFPILVKEFLMMPAAMPAVADALTRQGCSIAVLLGMELSQGLQRDAAVFYRQENCDRGVALSKHLEEWGRPSFGLTTEDITDAPNVHYYSQLNLQASRKQYVTAINDFLQQKK